MKNIIKSLYDLFYFVFMSSALCIWIYIYLDNQELLTIHNLLYSLFISLILLTIIRFIMINNDIKTDEEESEEYYFNKNINNYLLKNREYSSIKQWLILNWKKFRDSKISFNNFIKRNKKLDPNEYMYMYSDDNYDYFKNNNSRNYIKVRYVSYFKLFNNLLNSY